ncbi:hypothetical protein I4U23_020507 [Adineta vaga]|nr:hypothetical protein I4U23_020507 [Adineta vaga]
MHLMELLLVTVRHQYSLKNSNVVNGFTIFKMKTYNFDGLSVVAFTCNKQDNQIWIWNTTDGTVRSKHNGEYLFVEQELEIWATPLSDKLQAIVLLNRGDSRSEQITVQWTDIGFSKE